MEYALYRGRRDAVLFGDLAETQATLTILLDGGNCPAPGEFGRFSPSINTHIDCSLIHQFRLIVECCGTKVLLRLRPL
jgi:hypothetical protein